MYVLGPKAILLGLSSLDPNIKSSHIKILCDNSTAMASLSKLSTGHPVK